MNSPYANGDLLVLALEVLQSTSTTSPKGGAT